MNLTKYKLPTCAPLEQIHVDLEKLISFYQNSQDQFKDVVTSNQALCGIHHELTKSVYDNFKQISLTVLNPTHSTSNTIQVTDCENLEPALQKKEFKSFHERYRARKSMSTNRTALNEHMYDYPTELLTGSYIEEFCKQFKSPATRTRLVRLDPNSTVPPHIDYDPTYAVRIIVPIISDDECINIFWKKNEVFSYNLKPGKAYFLNTGLRHAVVNFSKSARTTLMLSLNGQKDIEHLEL